MKNSRATQVDEGNGSGIQRIEVLVKALASGRLALIGRTAPSVGDAVGY
jgi:hypothetical protein